MIVTVTATTMDGTVVRWYRDLADAQTYRPILAASRAGVMAPYGYLTDIPPEWMQAATQAHETLRRDPGADMSRLATHVNQGPANGPLVPVEEVDRG